VVQGAVALERCGVAGDYGRALQESKLDVPILFHEGRAAGRQPGSAAGARGSGTAETRARPNVEVSQL